MFTACGDEGRGTASCGQLALVYLQLMEGSPKMEYGADCHNGGSSHNISVIVGYPGGMRSVPWRAALQ
jgi:hypothetical protein